MKARIRSLESFQNDPSIKLYYFGGVLSGIESISENFTYGDVIRYKLFNKVIEVNVSLHRGDLFYPTYDSGFEVILNIRDFMIEEMWN